MVRGAVKWVAALAAAAVTAIVWRDLARTGRERGRLRSHWTTVDDLRFHARLSTPVVSGQRPAVVLVPGFLMSSLYMVPTAARLASEFSVYAPDLPGAGLTERPTQVLDVPGLAAALAGWMDSVGLGRAALVGNSLGCQIIADLAARHPERVERIVFLAPTVEPSARTPWQQAARLALSLRRERPSIALILAYEWGRAGARRLYRTMRFALEDRIEDKLPLVAAPTMVVRGDKDSTISKEWADEVARLARAERSVTLPGAGHATNYSDAEQVVRAITPFLLEGAAPSHDEPVHEPVHEAEEEEAEASA